MSRYSMTTQANETVYAAGWRQGQGACADMMSGLDCPHCRWSAREARLLTPSGHLVTQVLQPVPDAFECEYPSR